MKSLFKYAWKYTIFRAILRGRWIFVRFWKQGYCIILLFQPKRTSESSSLEIKAFKKNKLSEILIPLTSSYILRCFGITVGYLSLWKAMITQYMHQLIITTWSVIGSSCRTGKSALLPVVAFHLAIPEIFNLCFHIIYCLFRQYI